MIIYAANYLFFEPYPMPKSLTIILDLPFNIFLESTFLRILTHFAYDEPAPERARALPPCTLPWDYADTNVFFTHLPGGSFVLSLE